MNRILALGLTALAILLAGCDQPDGRFDFADPDDPDNLVVLEEEEGLMSYTASLFALVAVALAWRTWKVTRWTT